MRVLYKERMVTTVVLPCELHGWLKVYAALENVAMSDIIVRELENLRMRERKERDVEQVS